LVGDFRKVLDDPTVDALVCAAPNHWHGPAAILGCKAGKHVYVEKPASHNPQEGEWMVQAANKYQRCVQVGNQRRSSAGYRQAMEKLHAGVIGKVYL
jgi:predicted dehydrogenase